VQCGLELTKKPGRGRWPAYCGDECRRLAGLVPLEKRRKAGRPRTGSTWLSHGYAWVSPIDDAERAFPTSLKDGRIKRSHLVWNRAHPDDPVLPGQLVVPLNGVRDDDRPENLEKLSDGVREKVRRRGDPRPGARGPRPWLWRSHCLNDHPLTGPNLYVAPDGSRHCRQCGRERHARYRAKPESREKKREYDASRRLRSQAGVGGGAARERFDAA
jgi:hypothetical protein